MPPQAFLLPFKQFVLAPDLPHGSLHVCIPQRVDQGVEQGGDHGVEQSKHLVIPDRITHGHIGEDEGQEEHEHNSDVGATGRKGFAAALGWAGPQGAQDNDVRDDQGDKGQNGEHSCCGNGYNNQESCVSTCQFQQGEYVTEVVINLIGATEGKSSNN